MSAEQFFYISAPKEIFNLDHPYRPGAGELWVWHNGLPAIRDIDYVEINPFTIRFTAPCESGDTVLVRIVRRG